MRKIFEEYGGTIIAVAAAALLLVTLNMYFNPETGEIKRENSEYLDMLAEIPEISEEGKVFM